MAALTFRAAVNEDNTHTVTRSTGDGISTADAALIIDNTLGKVQAGDAIRALVRHWNRQSGKNSSPSTIATSGSDLE